jgi:hypothetical protein
VREPAADFTVPNLQANLGISRLSHSAHAPYLVVSELQTFLSKVMGVFLSAGSSVWDKEFVEQVSKRQALYGDTMRGQVPLQLILVSRQDGTDRFSVGLMARWKRRSLPERTKIPMGYIRSNPAHTYSRRKADAGVAA